MCLRMLPHGYEGVILVRVEMMMIRWISKDVDQYFGDVALLSPFLNTLIRRASPPSCFINKDGFMQNNSTSHKSCGVHPVLTLALLILLAE